MEKKFTLPKEFALKWIEALRSGEYKQGESTLVATNSLKPTLENTKFCCLGVAGYICGFSIKELNSFFYLEKNTHKAPAQISGGVENDLVRILSTFNDGFGDIGYKDAFTFRGDFKTRLNFSEIANFIEDNVEFI